MKKQVSDFPRKGGAVARHGVNHGFNGLLAYFLSYLGQSLGKQRNSIGTRRRRRALVPLLHEALEGGQEAHRRGRGLRLVRLLKAAGGAPVAGGARGPGADEHGISVAVGCKLTTVR